MSEVPRRFSVIIPVYNEAGGLESVLADLRAQLEAAGARDWEVIVVDDGSEDESARKAEAIEGVTLVLHAENRGYGASLKTGIARAQYDRIVIMDADGTYPAGMIPSLIARLDNSADMAVGSRKGSASVPLLRRPAKWMLGRLASHLTGRDIPDINSGLRAFRKDGYERYRFLLPDGFSFTTTITMAMLSGGWRVDYLPIEYKARIGRSKIRPIRDTLDFTALILRTSIYFNPLKVFLPVGVGLGLIGLVWGVAEALSIANVSTVPALFITTGLQVLALGLLADLIQKKIHDTSRHEPPNAP